MRTFVERHRHLSLLVAALLVQLFFLAYQIKGENDVRLIRRWAVAVITPVERLVRGGVETVGWLVDDYVALYGAQQENHRLKAELDQTRLRLHELEARAAESGRLAALLEMKQTYEAAHLLAARVIGTSPAATTRTVLIDRGSEDGIKTNMVVLTPEGIVGKVVAVFPTVAQVLLVTDQKSGVGALVAESSLLGVVKGTGSSQCRLDYISNQESIAAGALIVTSGQDQRYPKGLPIGRVETVRPGEIFQEITVSPAAPLSRLEHVLVLAGPPETLGTAAQTPARVDRLIR